jgi:tetratricopeptide (TPR) repeat protein
MVDDAERARVFALFDEANQAFAEGRYEDAKRGGELLIASQFSGGFEIVARSQNALCDVDGAVATLEAGVAKAPGVWVLWKLLADLRSEQGELESALAAYDRAAGCSPCDLPLVNFNRAIALHRGGRMDDALATLEAIDVASLPYAGRVLALRASVLRMKGRLDEASALLEAALENPVEDRGSFAAVCFELAQIELELGTDRTVVRPLVVQGLQADATLQGLELLCSIDDRTSEANGHWRLSIEGAIEEQGYLREFSVIAENAAQAEVAAMELLPEELRAAARVAEAELFAEMPGARSGVVSATGFIFFARGGGED